MSGGAGITSSGGSSAEGGAPDGASAGNASASKGGAPGSGGEAPLVSDGGGPTLPLGKCDGLAEVGKWEEVTPKYVKEHPTFTGSLVPIVNPANPSIVYTMTDSNGVFKSLDCGANWVKINTGRSAKDVDSGRIWGAIIDPIEPDTLYALTGYGHGGLWKTTNGGVDWDQVLPEDGAVFKTAGAFVERVAMDPTNHKHLLINFHLNCAEPNTPVCFGESKDAGATWVLRDFPKELVGGWGEGSGIIMLSPTLWLYEEGGLYYTADAGVTWAKVISDGGVNPCFPGDSRVTQTPDGTYYFGTQQGVIKSPDGIHWSRIPNSGSQLCPMIGDGTRLFAGTLNNPQLVYAAPYSDTSTWTKLDTPGLPLNPAQNMYVFAYDPAHHLLYGTIQTSGIFRVRTQ